MLEKTVQRNILAYLKIKNVFCWRNNSGGFYTQDKDGRHHCYRYGAVGSPDIIGIYKGKFLGIEVKRPDKYKKPTAAQKDFLARIRQHGGISFIATSIEDVDKYLFDKYGDSKRSD